MTPSAVLPGAGAGAVLRVMRGVAGRRVLLVALFVGGLFALGFLYGEQAHAADGTSPGAVTGVVTASSEAVRSALHAAPAEDAPAITVKSPPRNVEDGAEPAGGTAAPARRTAPATGSATALPGTVTAATDTATSTGTATLTPTGTATSTGTAALTDTVTAATGTVGRSARPVGEHVVRPVGEHVVRPVGEHVVRLVGEQVVRPVEARVVRPVVEQVLKPVGGLVETVADGLAGESTQFPPLPCTPSLPGLPEVPGLPVLPGIPADILPIGTAPQQSGGAAPERQDTIGHGDGAEARSHARQGVAYGPRFAHGSDSVLSALSDSPRGPQAAGITRTPAHQAPGDPAGALGRYSAVDISGPRHGEPHAVAVDHRAPMSLVPGVTAAVAADGTQDRHRDIPEFPG